jgi:hypothetical protein
VASVSLGFRTASMIRITIPRPQARVLCAARCAARWPSVALAAVLLAAAPVHAQADGDSGPARSIGADIKAYVTAPLHADRSQWIGFGATVGAIAAVQHYDERVRRHFVDPSAATAAAPDTHDSKDAAPAALALGGTWLAAVLTRDDDGRREAHEMVEAAAFSTVAAYALKELAGRERPYVTGDSSDWRKSGDSFPSMHTTAAFAIGTVLAESGGDHYRWARRALGYGLAAGTAYMRLEHDAHWLSDTVAGAGLGIATARFVMKRRADSERAGRVAIGPTDGGIGVSYVVDLRR